MKTLLMSVIVGLGMLMPAVGQNQIEITDVKGRKIMVEVLRANKENVTVTKTPGKEIKIPLKDLSEESKAAVSKELETQQAIAMEREKERDRQQAAIEAARPKGIIVTSLVIKRIKTSFFGDTFRYFFDIRNQGPEPFTGSVEITLQNATKGLTNGTEIFKTTQPMAVKWGTAQFMDAHTGPREFHGDYSVAGYTWKVLVDGKQVSSGRGVISEQVDDLTQR